MKKNLTSAVCLVLSLCLLLGACAKPAEPTGTTPPTAGGNVPHTVKLTSDTGKVLPNVGIFIYADAAMEDLVAFERTDANGCITFSAPEGTYTAVLKDVPAGYNAAASYPITETNASIVLSGTLFAPDANTRLGLGDMMCEMNVTAVDGATYTLSQLLQEKKAVILNFWFLGCNPCKAEFPYLQQAYDAYSADIEVLALDPVDASEAAIAQRQAELELTFPMVSCDPMWADIFSVNAYPTTVVIDRFGIISLIHKGSITDAQTFMDIFAFFTAEDYTQTVVTDLDQILIKPGTEQRPIELSGVEEFNVSLRPGALTWYHLYKVTDVILTVEDPNAYILCDGVKYEPQNGVITLELSVPDMYTPIALQFGTTAATEQTLTVKLTAKPGTVGNPFPLSTGSLTTDIAKDNNQGVYYLYSASENGNLTVSFTGGTQGVSYEYVLYNLTSGAYVNMRSENGETSLSVAVSAGDSVQLTIAAVSDAQGNLYPAAQFTSKVSFEKQETVVTPPVVDPTDPTDPTEPTEPAPTEPEREINTGMTYDELYVGNAYHIGTGETPVELLYYDITYFLFTPTQAGKYQFSATAPLTYYGSNTFFISDQTGTLADFANNTFTLSIKEGNIGASYLIGVTGSKTVPTGTVTITRIGDPDLDVTDYPWIEYVGTHTPAKGFAVEAGTKTYVDVAGSTAAAAIVKGSDGLYHLGTADGPIIYLDLGPNAKYLSLSEMIATTGMKKYFYNADGSFQKKEDYTQCIQNYVNCMDENTGVYPLTDDLIYILKEYGEYVGWWRNDSQSSYLFSEVSGLNTEIAWMFACCYFV